MNRFRLAAPSRGRGIAVGAGSVAIATLAMLLVRDDLADATAALVLVVPVVLAGLVGGRGPALITAVFGAVAYNVGFIEPYGTLAVERADELVALAVFVLVALVIGHLVAVEAERRQSAEHRARELEAANAELARMQAEREQLAEEATRAAVLERVDEQRASLLRSVSHDLRTPLATIRAVTSDLRDGTDYDAATRDELLDLVGDEAERLDRLVANLLSMSRIEAGALQPARQAVAVDELVDECTRRLQRIFRDIRLEIDVPKERLLLDVDYTQVDQVLTNLLENAARHAPMGSTVRLGARRAGAQIELSIADEGPGIAEFERDLVFEPFRRGYGSTSSGIGLAICRAIVEAHGGTITLGPGLGGGARFVVALPSRDEL